MTDINLFNYVNPYIHYNSLFLQKNKDLKTENTKNINIKKITLKNRNNKNIKTIKFTDDIQNQEITICKGINDNPLYYISISKSSITSYLLFINKFCKINKNIILHLNYLSFYKLFNLDYYSFDNLDYELETPSTSSTIERLLKNLGFTATTNCEKLNEQITKESKIPTGPRVSGSPSSLAEPTVTGVPVGPVVSGGPLLTTGTIENVPPNNVTVTAFRYKDKNPKHKIIVEKYFTLFSNINENLNNNLHQRILDLISEDLKSKERIKKEEEEKLKEQERIKNKEIEDKRKQIKQLENKLAKLKSSGASSLKIEKTEKTIESLEIQLDTLQTQKGGTINYKKFMAERQIKKLLMKGGFVLNDLLFTFKSHIYNYISYEVINQLPNSGGNIGYYKYDTTDKFHKLYDPINKTYSNTSTFNLKTIKKKIENEKGRDEQFFDYEIEEYDNNNETCYIILDNEYNKLDKFIKYIVIFNSECINKPSKNNKLLFGILFTNNKQGFKGKKTNYIYKYNYSSNVDNLDYIFYLSPIGVPYINFIINDNELLPIIPFLIDPTLLNNLNYGFFNLYNKNNNSEKFIENFNQDNNGYSKDKLTLFNTNINKNKDDFDYSKYLLNENKDNKHNQSFFKLDPELFKEKLLYDKNLRILKKNIQPEVEKKITETAAKGKEIIELITQDLFIDLANLDDKLFLDEEFTIIDLNELINIKIDEDELESEELEKKNNKIFWFMFLCSNLFYKSLFHIKNRNIDFTTFMKVDYKDEFEKEEIIEKLYKFMKDNKKGELNVDYLHSNMAELLIDNISNNIIKVTNTKYQDFIETKIIDKEIKEQKEKEDLLKAKTAPKPGIGSLLREASIRR